LQPERFLGFGTAFWCIPAYFNPRSQHHIEAETSRMRPHAVDINPVSLNSLKKSLDHT